MWPKEDYQEHMLGYLGEVQTRIEQLAHSRLLQPALNELYADLDSTFERLWRLIGASDVDWEGFRYPLEISCERLQRAFYRMPLPGTFMLSDEAAIYTLRANLTMGMEIRTNPDDRLDNNRYADSNVSNDFTRSLVRKELA